MRVAIAGAGSFAKYFVDELPRAGHEVVLLTRMHKPFFDGKRGLVGQRVTDYKDVEQLTQQLNDCDALVSTVADMTQSSVDVHLALIEACKRSVQCKKFIPAEFYGTPEDKPDLSLYAFNLPVRDALCAQQELEWTVVYMGWVAEYLLPAVNRHHPDFGLFPLNYETKTLAIPGTGNEKFAVTSVRDFAAAIAALLTSTTKWRPFTYVQGEETTWREVREALRSVAGLSDDQLSVSFESVADLQAQLERNESPEAVMLAEFKLYGPSGALQFDQSKVQRDRDEFFKEVRFRSVKELLEAVQENPTVVV